MCIYRVSNIDKKRTRGMDIMCSRIFKRIYRLPAKILSRRHILNAYRELYINILYTAHNICNGGLFFLYVHTMHSLLDVGYLD